MNISSLQKRVLVYAALFIMLCACLMLSVDYNFYTVSSGLTISSFILPWDPAWPYMTAFAVATVNSLASGLIAILFATIIGVGIGILGTLNNLTAKLICQLYVGTFRNVPVLFVILLFYFAGILLPSPAKAPDLFGLIFISNRGLVLPEFHLAETTRLIIAGLVLIISFIIWRLPVTALIHFCVSLVAIIAILILCFGVTAPVQGKFGFRDGFEIPLEFLALTSALSFYYAAEIAEITRGAIGSVKKGLLEAACALGLHRFDRFRKITAPLASRFGLPAALNTYLVVMKATSLGVAIGYTELFSVARLSMSSSGRIVESLSMMGIYFLLICGTLSLVINRINSRLKTQER